MTKTTILMTSIITVILFIAPIASGSLFGLTQTADAVPQQACPDGTTLDPSTKQCVTDPTCTTGTYNPATDQCEEVITVPATCASGTLNTATDLCETTITSAPTCLFGTLNTVIDKCVFRICIPFFGCQTFRISPTCSIGTYNTVTNLCEATLTSAPSCSIGTYNPATDVCDATLPSVATCSIGSLNTATDLCEISPDHGKIPLCHVAGKNGKTVEISVNIESLEGHLIHGDTVGSCE